MPSVVGPPRCASVSPRSIHEADCCRECPPSRLLLRRRRTFLLRRRRIEILDSNFSFGVYCSHPMSWAAIYQQAYCREEYGVSVRDRS
ncbi:hypothetical protein ACS0TY_022592 [Phlomoides rotata]